MVFYFIEVECGVLVECFVEVFEGFIEVGLGEGWWCYILVLVVIFEVVMYEFVDIEEKGDEV